MDGLRSWSEAWLYDVKFNEELEASQRGDGRGHEVSRMVDARGPEALGWIER